MLRKFCFLTKRKKRKGKKRKKEVSRVASKSQTWSLDILIAVSVFVVGIIIFFYIVTYTGDGSLAEDLAAESELIPEKLISPDETSAEDIVIVIGNKVDDGRLKTFISNDYEEVKSQLGIRSDFCIHFEDEEGNIVDLNDHPNLTQYSFGDPRLNITFVNETGDQVVIPCGS